jgi:UDP-4-amino-4,6-dideoxy-N-acetyl-beta-L-altrosamine N-acetyltransferase
MYTKHKITLKEHSDWFDKCSDDPDKYLLIYEHQGAPEGFIQFAKESYGPIAEWGFYSAPDAHKGTGTRIACNAINYGFDTLALHKIVGKTISFNQKSRNLHVKMGFIQEGCLREQYFDGKNYFDVIVFGLLQTEWRDIKNSDNYAKFK